MAGAGGRMAGASLEASAEGDAQSIPGVMLSACASGPLSLIVTNASDTCAKKGGRQDSESLFWLQLGSAV